MEKAIDIVKPPARTNLENWERGMNAIHALAMARSFRKKTIEVVQL
jgi:hypothetical protein